MRKLALVCLMAALAAPAFAARQVSVEQLGQLVTALHGKPDTQAAQQLYDLELIQRLSAASLEREQAVLPGPASRQALLVVADASAFLDLPVADLPSKPAPDGEEQRLLWAKALDYASRTIPRLPNFIATRDTVLFQDMPSQPPSDPTGPIKYEPMHLEGSATATVLYRDGQEFVDAGAKHHKRFDTSDFELSATGEFGPVLGTVLADSFKTGVAWSHWEQGPACTMAVFRYAVAREASHYTVAFPSPTRDIRFLSAYHGEIGINPEDGSILRITMIADLKPSDPGTRAGMMVEYGPVEIGGGTYICPVKSVALSQAWMVRIGTNSMSSEHSSRIALQTRVSDLVFRDYHLFRGDVRILSGEAAGRDGKEPAPAPAPPPATSPNR
jgi:hypothetical protein